MKNKTALTIVTAHNKPYRPLGWLELKIVDRRALVLVNQKVLAEFEFQPTDPPSLSASSQSATSVNEVAAVGAQGSEVEIRRLIVSRDVYYTPPADGSTANYQLGPDEYFMLGDNSPQSVDSRIWSPSGLAASQLVGSVINW